MDVITFPVNLKTTCGLSILLHGVISLSDATSYDKHVKIITCDPKINTKDNPDLSVCSFMENSVGPKNLNWSKPPKHGAKVFSGF